MSGTRRPSVIAALKDGQRGWLLRIHYPPPTEPRIQTEWFADLHEAEFVKRRLIDGHTHEAARQLLERAIERGEW